MKILKMTKQLRECEDTGPDTPTSCTHAYAEHQPIAVSGSHSIHQSERGTVMALCQTQPRLIVTSPPTGSGAVQTAQQTSLNNPSQIMQMESRIKYLY